MKLPESLRRTILSVHGERGERWLARLPQTLTWCQTTWHLRGWEVLPNLSYNLVVGAEHEDGTAVIVKLGVPDDALRREAAALRHYAGRGAVRLLAADETRGALLLERLEPGRALSSLAEEAFAVQVFCRVANALLRPPPANCSFPTVADWAQGLNRLCAQYDGGTGPLPAPLVDQAEGLFAELWASAEERTLLHGDLHHDNMLLDGETWLAIDPKGVVGEPCYEAVVFLRNHLLDQEQPERVLRRRIAVISEALGCDRQRLAAWGLAHCVLSACWSLADGVAGWQDAIACAGMYRSILSEERC